MWNIQVIRSGAVHLLLALDAIRTLDDGQREYCLNFRSRLACPDFKAAVEFDDALTHSAQSDARSFPGGIEFLDEFP